MTYSEQKLYDALTLALFNASVIEELNISQLAALRNEVWESLFERLTREGTQ